VDFCYTTNAGSNGNTSLLLNGDARGILNGVSLYGPEPCDLGTQTTTTSPDTFAGNNNGGADGSALAYAKMDEQTVSSLGAGDYKVTLTGTVKGNNDLANIAFSVTSQPHISAGNCTHEANP
jgi:hypothetical protein